MKRFLFTALALLAMASVAAAAPYTWEFMSTSNFMAPSSNVTASNVACPLGQGYNLPGSGGDAAVEAVVVLPSDFCAGGVIEPYLGFYANGTSPGNITEHVAVHGLNYRTQTTGGSYSTWSEVNASSNLNATTAGNYTLQEVHFGQIPAARIGASAAVHFKVVRYSSSSSSDTFANGTVPVFIRFDWQRCRTR